MQLQSLRAIALASVITTTAAKQCRDLTVPVTVSAQNGVFNLTAPASDIDTTNFILNFIRQGHLYPKEILRGQTPVSGTYNLAATYCEPDSGPSSTIQILTHGLGFDRSYWDFPTNNGNYSYVTTAVDTYNYSTLAYDRLGVGQSSHSNPVAEIQAPLEVAALGFLTGIVHSGSLGRPCGGGNHTFEKVVHVGHSFGSVLSYTLAQNMPKASDGLVLTGFTQNVTFQPIFLAGTNLVLASSAMESLAGYPAGYIASGSKSGAQLGFFSPGQFDPAVLDAAFAAEQPIAVGELLTAGGGTMQASLFAGPVLIITGERDVPFCGGDCFATGNPNVTSLLAPSRAAFRNATVFETVVVPGAGHGLNLEYSHPFTYSAIGDFLAKNVH